MKRQIYAFDTKENPSLDEVGGKALSLISTTKAGLPVPEGLALTVAFFQLWTDHIKAKDEWRALLENPGKENCDKVKSIAAKLTMTED